jgi:hypothetical protein
MSTTEKHSCLHGWSYTGAGTFADYHHFTRLDYFPICIRFACAFDEVLDRPIQRSGFDWYAAFTPDRSGSCKGESLALQWLHAIS